MESKSFQEKLKELKKTIPFKWRVQSTFPKNNPTHAQMIAYVDARDVQEQLDNVVGAAGWQNDFKDLNGRLFGGIGILVNNDWVWKWDRGTQTKTEAEKGEASDAFKRAAVEWGINRDAYKVGVVKVPVKEYAGKYYPCDETGKFLKGDALHKYCNNIAKTEDLENYNIEFSDSKLTERYDILDTE
jgi:hypothetical protein